MSSITTDKQTFRLMHDREDNVLVHPPNDDLHIVTSKEAVEAIEWFSPLRKVESLLKEQIQELESQLRLLIDRLREWCHQHSSHICRADLRILPQDGCLFVVMQKDIPYNFELSDKLTALDIEIAQNSDYKSLTCNVLAIPRCSTDAAQAFIDLNNSIPIANFTLYAQS